MIENSGAKNKKQNRQLTKSHRTIIFITALLTLLMIIIMEVFVPSLPAIQLAMDSSTPLTQWTIGLYLLGFSCSQLIYGPLADDYGRRKLLLLGLTITLFGSLLTVIASSIYPLLAGRLIQGLGFGAVGLLTRVLLRDIFAGEQLAKTSSLIGTVAALTIGLAPVLGGVIEEFLNWRSNFVVILGLVMMMLLVSYGYLPETSGRLNKQTWCKKKLLHDYLQPLNHPFFWLFSACSGLAFSGLVAYAMLAPFILQQQFGLQPIEYGSLSIMIAVAQTFGYSLNARYIEQMGIHKAMRIGCVIMLAAGVLLFLSAWWQLDSVPLIVIAMVIFTLGTSFIYANAYAGAFTPFSDGIGSLSAMYNLVQMGSVFLVSSLIALIPQNSTLNLGIVFISLASMITLLQSLLVRTKQYPKSSLAHD